NYPNPFNPETNISFYLNRKNSVKLKIFDMLGNLIETLVDKELQAGKHSYKFVTTKYSSGIYFYQLQTESFSQVRKMILLK
ncbi:MAG: T9SS type A sorting domain-containing protein, partial [Ignavibacteria bacterium]|nr:T9SS type A sorting domain-containing protein [Ignavibacteria bacterium]